MRWDRTKGKPEPVHLLDRVPVQENGEPLADLRKVVPHVRMLRPQTIPFARLKVAEMVGEAARIIEEHGVFLGVTDAWRPFERQQRIYDWMTQQALEAFPERTFASIRRTVNRWVAPPHRKSPPGHCTGGAIDVNLVDKAGEVVDVSAPFDRFKAAPTYALGLEPEAQRWRMLLVETMLMVGFSNCRDEWWHYSYGDAGWAVRLEQPYCVYGLATLPRELYEEQERLAAEAMKDRPNPFLSN